MADKMDKMTKGFIIILGGLFALITFVVLFGDYSYQLKGIVKPNNAVQEDTGSSNAENSKNMLNSYSEVMHQKIVSKWSPPSVKEDGKVVLEFTIKKNGRVVDAKVDKSSGNKELDESALKALHRASPLPRLPLNLNQETLTVKFDFVVKAADK